jgi:hypothetical protein
MILLYVLNIGCVGTVIVVALRRCGAYRAQRLPEGAKLHTTV